MRVKLQTLLVIGMFSFSIVAGTFVFVKESSADRLFKQSEPKFSQVNMSEYTDDEALIELDCSQGGNSSSFGNGVNSSATNLRKCTTYTTTTANKVGALKVLINGTAYFIDLKNWPN